MTREECDSIKQPVALLNLPDLFIALLFPLTKRFQWLGLEIAGGRG